MRAVVQRVKSASVTIGSERYSSIEKGFLVLLGIHEDDCGKDAELIAKKLGGLRVFEDAQEKINLSLSDVDGSVLLVSQFTLYGDCSHGFRPSFITAARPEKAIPLYEQVIALLREKLGNDRVQTGVFGADMSVTLVNDGPVTILLDTKSL